MFETLDLHSALMPFFSCNIVTIVLFQVVALAMDISTSTEESAERLQAPAVETGQKTSLILSYLHLPNLLFLFGPCLHLANAHCSGATWTTTTAAEMLVRRATGLPIAGPARHAGARPRRRKVSKVRK